MDKKQYVLKVLDLLKDSLPLARGLIFMIQNTNMEDSLLDTLITSFQESIATIKDENVLIKLQKGKAFLEELKRRESDSKKLDDEDISHLDTMLSQI